MIRNLFESFLIFWTPAPSNRSFIEYRGRKAWLARIEAEIAAHRAEAQLRAAKAEEGVWERVYDEIVVDSSILPVYNHTIIPEEKLDGTPTQS